MLLVLILTIILTIMSVNHGILQKHKKKFEQGLRLDAESTILKTQVLIQNNFKKEMGLG
jgi:hypothetical protein